MHKKNSVDHFIYYSSAKVVRPSYLVYSYPSSLISGHLLPSNNRYSSLSSTSECLLAHICRFIQIATVDIILFFGTQHYKVCSVYFRVSAGTTKASYLLDSFTGWVSGYVYPFLLPT